MTFRNNLIYWNFQQLQEIAQMTFFRKVNGNNGAHFHLRQFTLNGISVNDNN